MSDNQKTTEQLIRDEIEYHQDLRRRKIRVVRIFTKIAIIVVLLWFLVFIIMRFFNL